MENQKIKIDYQGSGVKTANGFSTFLFIISVIAIIVSLIGFTIYLDSTGSYYSYKEENAFIGIALTFSFVLISFGSFSLGIICKLMSTIAKTSLYKRALLEEQYCFEENTKNTNELKTQVESTIDIESPR